MTFLQFLHRECSAGRKACFQVAIVEILVNYLMRFLAESDHADLAFRTTQRTWGQLFHLPNPFLVQKRLNLEYIPRTPFACSVIDWSSSLVCVIPDRSIYCLFVHTPCLAVETPKQLLPV
jgi:hypothetical protein